MGYSAKRIAVYETHENAVTGLLASLPGLQRVGGILIHSPRAGRVVRCCLDESERRFDGVIYCISAAAAAPFVGMEGIDIRVAARPDEASMLALIGNT